jgi:hypothetical protein
MVLLGHVGSYRQIFGHIRRKYSRITNNQLLPVNIITDFETGLINAAETPSAIDIDICNSRWDFWNMTSSFSINGTPTIHGFYRDRVIPLVFALMVDRHVGSYRQIFGHIRRKYSRITNNQLLPVNIITDFYSSVIQLPQVNKQWP